MVLLLDNGGVRTLWSLLALQKLIEYIAIEEERDGVAHSFFPDAYPGGISQFPLPEEEQLGIDKALSWEKHIKSLVPTRRYLPCHYFDDISGAGTGS